MKNGISGDEKAIDQVIEEINTFFKNFNAETIIDYCGVNIMSDTDCIIDISGINDFHLKSQISIVRCCVIFGNNIFVTGKINIYAIY